MDIKKIESNIDLWLNFEGTDPSYTKQSKVSGMIRTSADAQYKKKQITKAFGPMGLGWGVIAESEKYERITYDNQTVLLNYTATAFFVLDDKRGEFPIAAGIKEAFITSNGSGYLKIDEEAIKKVRTDAVTKGFTDLGFCSDIHLGKFDDSTYVTAAYAKADLEKETDTEEAMKKAIEELVQWTGAEIEACKKILPKNVNGFKAAMNGLKRKITTKCAAVNINSTKYTKRIDEIVEEELTKLNSQGA